MLNTILALIAFYYFLTIKPLEVIISGFFIGLFWFYWISFSFEYYNFSALIPFVIVGFGFIYALFFAPLALSYNPFIRALALFALSFIEPLDFNWMVLELPFLDSYFGILKWQFALILIALSLFIYFKRAVFLLLLLFAINYETAQKELPNLKITLASTQIKQDEKWLPRMRNKIIDLNLDLIKDAIDKKSDLVILPESVFPLFMNNEKYLIEYLRELSNSIAIVAGAIEDEDGVPYNVTYIFNKGKVQIAKKMVLVPFGEYTPLPSFAKKWVNEFFFDNALEYSTTPYPSDFTIKGVKFRNAICYEATCSEIYEDRPKYVIAISNNGWFTPSIEPTLQNLLIKYYAKKYNSTVLHVTNMSGSKIVR